MREHQHQKRLQSGDTPAPEALQPESSAGVLAPLSMPSPVERVQSFNFDRWYTEYRGLVRSVINRFIRDPNQIDDIAQNVWARIDRVGHRYDPTRGKESTFIHLITRHAVLDYIEKERRHQGHADAVELSVGADVRRGDRLGPGENPLREAIDREERAHATGLMERLKPMHRRLLEMSLGHGAMLQEIARELDIPLGTVKSRLHYARENLRALATVGGETTSD